MASKIVKAIVTDAAVLVSIAKITVEAVRSEVAPSMKAALPKESVEMATFSPTNQGFTHHPTRTGRNKRRM